jgi:hypothetical protein
LISNMVHLRVQVKEYAPVHVQDEGAFRGATCFHYYPLSFQERAGVR